MPSLPRAPMCCLCPRSLRALRRCSPEAHTAPPAPATAQRCTILTVCAPCVM